MLPSILPALIALMPTAGDAPREPVTYSRDVAPIVQAKCQSCHRPGQIGPFALMDYRDAARRKASIAEAVEDGRMPPWNADPKHGHFANDRSLTERERSVLLAWVEQGAPEGDPGDLPAPRAFPEGEWAIGTPDAVFALPEPVQVKADGTMPYQWVRVPTGFTEDKWLKALELRPGNRAVVHHILVFVVGPDGRMVRGGGARGGQLAGYVPGDEPTVFPDGLGKKIPAGSSLIFQIHYTPVGKPVEDRSALALKFAEEPPSKVVRTLGIPDTSLRIPPGAPNYEGRSTFTFPSDSRLLSLWPHMHLRGKDFSFTATYPDGREEVLLSVPAYDFNWQTTYVLSEPMPMPKGTRIECVAHYDNSADNPNNPDPSKLVRWGEQTSDEMLIGYIDYVADQPPPPGSDVDDAPAPRPGAQGDPRERIKAAFERFDADRDDVLTSEELPYPQIFERLDLDGDGKLTREEAEKAVDRLQRGGPGSATPPVSAPAPDGPSPKRSEDSSGSRKGLQPRRGGSQ